MQTIQLLMAVHSLMITIHLYYTHNNGMHETSMLAFHCFASQLLMCMSSFHPVIGNMPYLVMC